MAGMGYAAVFGSLCPVGCIWKNRFGEASGEDPGAFLCFEGKKDVKLQARVGGGSWQGRAVGEGWRVSRQGRTVGEDWRGKLAGKNCGRGLEG